MVFPTLFHRIGGMWTCHTLSFTYMCMSMRRTRVSQCPQRVIEWIALTRATLHAWKSPPNFPPLIFRLFLFCCLEVVDSSSPLHIYLSPSHSQPLSFLASTPDKERILLDRKISDRRNCSARQEATTWSSERSVVYVLRCHTGRYLSGTYESAERRSNQ